MTGNRQINQGCRATTLVELVVAVSMMVVLMASLLPILSATRKTFDTQCDMADALQNGRILIDKLSQELGSAQRIIAVSQADDTSGYIEYERYKDQEHPYRFAINSANHYVQHGRADELVDLAGPVTQLQFTCYDVCDLGTPITDLDAIRYIKVRASVVNAGGEGRDLTFLSAAFVWADSPDTIDPNLIVWWKFDDSGGTLALDSSGHENEGDLEDMDSSTAWVPGLISGALDFDGVDDHVYLSRLSDSISGDFTVSLWFKTPTTFTDEGHFLNLYREEIEGVSLYGSGNDHKVEFKIKGGPTLQADAVPYNDNLWHHVVGTRSGPDYTLYVDNTLIETDNDADLQTYNKLRVGQKINDDHEYNGRLDDIRIYNYALSLDKIDAIFAQGAGPVFVDFTEAKLPYEGSSIAIATPSGAAEGNLLIAMVATDGDTSATLAPPASGGWTQISVGHSSGSVTLGVWWKIAEASESASHEFTWSGSEQAYGAILQFIGNDFSDPIHAWAASSSISTSPSSPSVSTTLNNCLILRLGAFDDVDITVDNTGLLEYGTATMDGSRSPSTYYEGFSEAKLSMSGTSITINKPTNTAVGDLLIAALVTNGKTKDDQEWPLGWEKIDKNTKDDEVTFSAWWKVAEAGDPSTLHVSWAEADFPEQQAYAWIMRFTGYDPDHPINRKSTKTGVLSSPLTPEIDTSNDNDSVVLRMGGFDGDSITLDSPGLSGNIPITMDRSSAAFGSNCSGGAGYTRVPLDERSPECTFSLTAVQEYVTISCEVPGDPDFDIQRAVSGGAGYLRQQNPGTSGILPFLLTALQEARTITIAIAPPH